MYAAKLRKRTSEKRQLRITSAQWDTLPLLPIRCILEHLSLEDALAAASTCRQWRQALLLYDGHRETLELRPKQLEKSLFLTRIFRKHTRKLHIYMSCYEDELSSFMIYVLPHFFDAMNLQEVVFIGRVYLYDNTRLPYTKLNRVITESLVYRHQRTIQSLAFLDCEMESVKNVSDIFVHEQVEPYSKPLCFGVTSPADVVFSRSNVDLMIFSTLEHLIFDYELITKEGLETLSHLKNLKQLSLNIINKRHMTLTPIDWDSVNERFSNGLDVAVNIINLPQKKFRSVIENVLVEGMTLTSLKVMFCNTLFFPLITHVCCMYSNTLRELVWADCPHDPKGPRVMKMLSEEELIAETYNEMNPFILLCWQCTNLRRLAIHGYWVWHYDFLGFVRLRNDIKLEISSIYDDQSHSPLAAGYDNTMRVMRHDRSPIIDAKFVKKVNKDCGSTWSPFPWRRLHAALRFDSLPDVRAQYVVKEALQPLGVT